MATVEQTGVELVVEGLRQFMAQMQQADKSVDGLGATAGKSSSILDGAFATALGVGIVKAAEAAIKAVVALGKAVIGLAKEGLQAYADYERLGASLQALAAREMVNAGQANNVAEAMGAAGGKAQELLGWIQQLAIESPFTQAGVADAFRTAMAYGFTTDEAKRLTGAMIDFAAGSGATEGSMNQIALALGQIQAKGKLSGQEVLQLVNAGLAVDQILAKAFGKSTAEIVAMREKGLIPADDAINAIVESLETDFGGAAKRQANTFSGLISTLQDVKAVGLREFFTGTFQAIQPYLTTFVNTLSSPEFMASVREIGEQVGGFVTGILDAFRIFGKGIEAGIDPLDALKLALQMAFGPDAVSSITNTIDFISNAIVTLSTFWTGTLLPAIQATISWIQANVIPILQQVWEWLGVNVPIAIQFLSELWTSTLLPAIQTAFLWIQANVFPIIDWLIAAIQQFPETLQIWAQNWEMFKEIIATVWENIKAAVQNGINAIVNFWSVGNSSIWQDIATIWGTIATVIVGFLALIVAALAAWWGAFGTFWREVWEGVKQILAQTWENILAYMTNVLTGLQTIVSTAWNAISTIISNGLQMWRLFVNTVASLIRGDFQQVWDNIKEIFRLAWDSLKTIVSASLDNIKTVISTGWESIKIIFTGALANIKTAFTSIDWGAVGKSIIEGIANGISNAAGMIADAAKAAAQAALNAAKAALGIDSPSKVFEKEVGRNIPGGIAAGITDSTPMLANQMRGLSDALLLSTRGLTEYVSSLAPASAAGRTTNYNSNANSSSTINNMIHMTPALALETVGMTLAA